MHRFQYNNNIVSAAYKAWKQFAFCQLSIPFFLNFSPRGWFNSSLLFRNAFPCRFQCESGDWHCTGFSLHLISHCLAVWCGPTEFPVPIPQYGAPFSSYGQPSIHLCLFILSSERNTKNRTVESWFSYAATVLEWIEYWRTSLANEMWAKTSNISSTLQSVNPVNRVTTAKIRVPSAKN